MVFFVGFDTLYRQYMGVDNGRLAMARTIMRSPDANKWNIEAIQAIQVTPWQLHESTTHHGIDMPPAQIRENQVQDDIDLYGFTPSCTRCMHDQRYGFGRTNKGHTQACRQRISTDLAKTAAGRERIEATTGRIDRSLAEFVENHDRHRLHEASAQGENRPEVLPQQRDNELLLPNGPPQFVPIDEPPLLAPPLPPTAAPAAPPEDRGEEREGAAVEPREGMELDIVDGKSQKKWSTRKVMVRLIVLKALEVAPMAEAGR